MISHLLQDLLAALLCCLIHPGTDHSVRLIIDKTSRLVLEEVKRCMGDGEIELGP